MTELKRTIKSIATEVGFTHFGISDALPLEEEGQKLKEWLDHGYHGSMKWMENKFEWRTNPESYFPGTRAIISLGINYYTPNRHSGAKNMGKISNYAWGEDYHDVLDNKLSIMTGKLEKLYPHAKFKSCCDTAPVMEKALAVRAGIGWIGKNTNLLTKETGSWLFLAEILTDLELEPDFPVPDFCGSCTICLDSCPTNALAEPYVLDSNLCISYLTIEHRGEFDENTPSLDGWIYGCDICQEVCPWNSFQTKSDEYAFQPLELGTEIDVEFASNVSDEEFRAKFKGSPIKRTKAEGLRRNARKL